MSHANAALTPKARLRLARLIVGDGWKPAEAAKMFMVSTGRPQVGDPFPGRGCHRDAGSLQPAPLLPTQDA